MLDIRYPIGVMFLILGAILTVFGVVSNQEMYKVHSLGVNINLVWGCVLLVFGAFMFLMAVRAQRRGKKG
jgi:uncharacterized membrane protein